MDFIIGMFVIVAVIQTVNIMMDIWILNLIIPIRRIPAMNNTELLEQELRKENNSSIRKEITGINNKLTMPLDIFEKRDLELKRMQLRSRLKGVK